MASAKADHILDIAERKARIGGYDGFSFRDIAAEVGIKSASVHYHFPTKADLGAAMTRRYTDRFIDALGDPRDSRTLAQKIAAYIDAFRSALVTDDLMCLCGIFGAEIARLPDQVAREARDFFARSKAWLLAAHERDGSLATPHEREVAALALIAKLEGAMLLARSMDDTAIFDQVLAAPR